MVHEIIRKHTLTYRLAKMTIRDKQQIIQFMDKNPLLSMSEIAQHFSTVFNREISRHTVLGIKHSREQILNYQGDLGDTSLKQNPKEFVLMRELYDAVPQKPGVSQKQNLTEENLKSLVVKLAANDKYQGYFSSFEFCEGWIAYFCRKFNLKYIRTSVANLTRKNFSQELFEEMCRRQSLTDENVTSYKQIRALALELARDPKYEKHMGSSKFGNLWIAKFRENFNLKGNFFYDNRRKANKARSILCPK